MNDSRVYKVLLGYDGSTWSEEIFAKSAQVGGDGSLHLFTEAGVVKYNRSCWLKCEPMSIRGPE
jgi:hypothetical protein